MFRRTIAFCFILFFICSQPVFSKTQKDNIENLTKDLMAKSGLNKQVQNTPDVLNAAVSSNFRKTVPTSKERLGSITKKINTIISKSFKPEIIKSVVATHIETELNIDDIKSVLNWLYSPLGEKITKFEEEASTAESYKDMTITIPILKMRDDYEERFKLMLELDKHINATESTLEQELNMQIVSLTAMSSAFPALNLPSTEAVKSNFENYRNSIREQISHEIAMSSLYTYRELEIYEIKKYIDFIKTDYGVRYHKVVHDGLGKALLFCGKKFGENVGHSIAEKSDPNLKLPDSQTYPQKK